MTEEERQEKITQVRERLKAAYAAELRALEAQSTANAEGEQTQFASLAQIREMIKELESELNNLLNPTANVTMFWSMRNEF